MLNVLFAVADELNSSGEEVKDKPSSQQEGKDTNSNLREAHAGHWN